MVDCVFSASWVRLCLFHTWFIALRLGPNSLTRAENSLVQTDMGNMGARMMGLAEAPNTLEESTNKTIALVSFRLLMNGYLRGSKKGWERCANY